MKKNLLILLLLLLLVGCNNKSLNYENDNKNDNIDKNIYNTKEILFADNLSDYKDYFSNFIEEVKKKYTDFNDEDYLVFYLNKDRMDSDYRTMTFMYKIGNNIRTNYMITIDYEDGKITNLNNSIDSILEYDLDSINNKIKLFEDSKENIINKEITSFGQIELNADNSINITNLDNVDEIDEYYYYNFTDSKLYYKVEFTINQDNIISAPYYEIEI